MKYILFFLVFFASIGKTFSQDAVYERAVHVWMTRDGDSFMVSDYENPSDSTANPLPYSQAYQVRLFGADTPENMIVGYVSAQQKHARESGDAVRKMMTGKRVMLDSVTIDEYGRLVARIQLPDGKDLAKVVVAGGLGWDYFPNYPKNPSAFLRSYKKDIEEMRRFARANDLGLFGLEGRKIRPETFRKQFPGKISKRHLIFFERP